MPTVRLTRRLWAEYEHQAQSLAARQAAEARKQRRLEQHRNELVERHMPMVRRIAEQVLALFTRAGRDGYGSRIEIEDLIQLGNLGLVEAARRYEPSSGEFAPFAYFRVRGAMIDAHKRRAYREHTHQSVEAITERMGFLPAYVSRDTRPLPDEMVYTRQLERMAASAIRELPEDQRSLLLDALAGTPLAESAAARGRSVAWARSKLAAARDTVAAAVRGEKRAA